MGFPSLDQFCSITLRSLRVEKLQYTNWDFLIDDLIGPKGRTSTFGRELLLYQLQTWIYIPGECEELNSTKSYQSSMMLVS